MFDNKEYVPILKWKRGERTALEKLNHHLKHHMTPLLEIQPIPYDFKKGDFKKSLDEHLANIGVTVKESWGLEKPIFVDAFTIYDNEDFDSDTKLLNDKHPLEFIVESIESNDTPVVPVTGLLRYPEFNTAIKRVVDTFQRGVCIRLTSDDLADLEALKSDLEQLTKDLNLSKNAVDIVLDYKHVNDKQRTALLQNLILVIAQFPFLHEWRTFTISATSIPRTLGISTNSTGSITRTEWLVYKQIKNSGLSRIPSFSDYNINNPDFVNIDPRFMKIAAGVKYTIPNEFLIHRGSVIKNNGFGQMTAITQALIQHKDYAGPSFSYGDQYIFDCAHGGATGSPEYWVIVGVNHHLTHVVNALANLYGFSISDLQ